MLPLVMPRLSRPSQSSLSVVQTTGDDAGEDVDLYRSPPVSKKLFSLMLTPPNYTSLLSLPLLRKKSMTLLVALLDPELPPSYSCANFL